jgi:putative transposase
MKAFKYRLKPTSEQEGALRQTGGACRWLWNKMLEQNKAKYEQEKKFVFKYDLVGSLPKLKELHPWLKEMPSQSLQQRCWDLDTAMKRCFKSGFGFPKFKSKDDENDTFRISQTNGHIKVTRQAIKLPKLGWINWRRHRPIDGRLMSVTIKQEGIRWYAICLCDTGEVLNQISVCEDDIVGIDLGLSCFAMTSDGELFEKPAQCYQRLKHEQRKLSRIDESNKKQGITKSNRRLKQKQILAKTHRIISDQRYDFHHKTSREIANFYKFAGMEDLHIKGMMKNHCLAGSIAKAGWHSFRMMIRYKLKDQGGDLLLADRFYPSTKLCSSCGHKQAMTLADRTFTCESCGMEMNRDANAAINLKLWAMREMNRAGTVRIYARGDTAIGDEIRKSSRCVSLKREKFRDNQVLEAATSLGSR